MQLAAQIAGPDGILLTTDADAGVGRGSGVWAGVT
jgi:hypothetical protein